MIRQLVCQVQMQTYSVELHPFPQIAVVQSIGLDDEAYVVIDDVRKMQMRPFVRSYCIDKPRKVTEIDEHYVVVSFNQDIVCTISRIIQVVLIERAPEVINIAAAIWSARLKAVGLRTRPGKQSVSIQGRLSDKVTQVVPVDIIAIREVPDMDLCHIVQLQQ